MKGLHMLARRFSFCSMYDLNDATEWATSDEDHFGKDCSLYERMQEFYLHEACDLQVCVV